MSPAVHVSRRWLGLLAAGVVAASTFATAGPASAAAPTNTKLSTSTPSVGVGETVKLKAIVKPASGTAKPTGSVTFKEGNATAGTATLATVGTAQTAKLELSTLSAGSHTFTASYNGSADFNASTSLSVTVVVGKSKSTTTASSSTPAPAPGQDVKLKAVVKQVSGPNKPTGSVTFKDGATTLGTSPLELIGTVETAKLTVAGGLSNGSHTITATYSGSPGFEGSSSTVDIDVAKAATTSTLTVKPVDANPGKSTIAVAVAPVPPATGVPSGLVTFVVDNQANQVFSLSNVGKAQFPVKFDVGTKHTVKVTYGGDSLFTGSNATANFTS